jgi:hypothetical protein
MSRAPSRIFPRTVSRETLDILAPSDPRALRSRRDLQRVNRFLGTRRIIERGMQPAMGRSTPGLRLRVLELGAGDGSLMLRIAQDLSKWWPAAHVTLLDRLALLSAETSAAFARLGWSVEMLSVDVLDWAAAPAPPRRASRWDVIVANLFLHHFDELLLPGLLSAIAARCDLFVACEPRRTFVSLIGSHLVGVLGASRVTREDAVLSVRAGFRDAELSGMWRADSDEWQLQEHAAGLFSHFFSAARRPSASG